MYARQVGIIIITLQFSACCEPTLLLAERRNALSVLDYALVSGPDAAPKVKADVEATMKRTSEEVSDI